MPSILMWSPRPAGCVCVEGACGVAGARDQRVRARLPVLARFATLSRAARPHRRVAWSSELTDHRPPAAGITD